MKASDLRKIVELFESQKIKEIDIQKDSITFIFLKGSVKIISDCIYEEPYIEIEVEDNSNYTDPTSI